MTDALVAAFSNIPAEWSVFFLSMIPITELRASIPLGITTYQLDIWPAALLSLAGNTLIVAVVLAALPWGVRILSRTSAGKRFFDWLFARTRRKFASSQARFGLFVGLMLFVAIPLPLTGGWTGAVAAYLFGMPYGRALLSVTLGMAIAALVVSLASIGVLSVV